jgi:hypothetical protein
LAFLLERGLRTNWLIVAIAPYSNQALKFGEPGSAGPLPGSPNFKARLE